MAPSQRPRKQNPPHVKLFRASCDACGRVFEGNFPMWVQIGSFPCICRKMVPAPTVYDEGGQILAMD